jgi:anaerobic selenocysteine-containing dehydrogenase
VSFSSGKAPTGWTGWNGTLYNAFKWCQDGAHGPVDAGSREANIAAGNAHINDGEYATKRDMQHQAAGLDVVASVYGADNGFDYVKSHGMMWNASHQPAYWRVKYDAKGEGSVAGSAYAPGCRYKPGADTGLRYMLTVYNPRLDNIPDLVDSSGNKVTYHTESDGTFHGHPVYIPVFQHTNTPAAYDMYLTTYKINVHTQSRTANLPRLQEIIGNSWVVIHPDDAAAIGVVNGDLVKVTTLQNGVATYITGAAKVTPKAQKGCVHISHSQGHRLGVYTVDGSDSSAAPAFGSYQVDEGSGYKGNRFLSKSLNNPAPSPANDSWRQAAPPSAPGHGIHPNTIITRWLYAGDLVAGDGKGDLSTDPIGGSIAWFDTKCKIEKA